jgi:hypothetical protein
MAFYIPYIAGSVSLAYLYSYAYGPSIETIANAEDIAAIDSEHVVINAAYEGNINSESANDLAVSTAEKLIIDGVKPFDMSARVTKLETYYSCSVCNMELPIINFSKNQQKKIKEVWKCKECAAISA